MQQYWRRQPLDVAVVLFNELLRDFQFLYLLWLLICMFEGKPSRAAALTSSAALLEVVRKAPDLFLWTKALSHL